MTDINFVPDDYIRNNESRRTNLMYILLLGAVMTALCGSFMTIMIRKRALAAKERLVNTKLAEAQEAIKQFEKLQTKRKAMLKTALTTSELLEPVPRSVLLASLTNNLPPGTSLLKLSIVQRKPKKNTANKASSTNKYQKSKAKKQPGAETTKISMERMMEMHISIEGVAPSDLQVASCIEHLNNSNLLDNIALVESKEYKMDDTTFFRQFKLTAMLKQDVHLTKEDISKIRAKYRRSAFN